MSKNFDRYNTDQKYWKTVESFWKYWEGSEQLLKMKAKLKGLHLLRDYEAFIDIKNVWTVKKTLSAVEEKELRTATVISSWPRTIFFTQNGHMTLGTYGLQLVSFKEWWKMNICAYQALED